MKFLLPFTSIALLACSCGSKCPEPQYEGKASDEAYLTMVDAELRATADDMKAAKLTLADGAEIPGDVLPTFRWVSTLAAASPRAVPRVPRETPWYRGLIFSEAYAHLPPVTGVIHWFKFTVPGEQCPVELLSTRTEWTPIEEIWTKLKKGTGPRSVTAQSAYLTENRITEGPYKTPAAISFSITP